MTDLPAYRRGRRGDLISRWWPRQALTRTTLPLPVTPIRFWAALWLFILGTVAYSPDVTGSGAGVLSVLFFAAGAEAAADLAGAAGALVAAGAGVIAGSGAAAGAACSFVGAAAGCSDVAAGAAGFSVVAAGGAPCSVVAAGVTGCSVPGAGAATDSSSAEAASRGCPASWTF